MSAWDHEVFVTAGSTALGEKSDAFHNETVEWRGWILANELVVRPILFLAEAAAVDRFTTSAASVNLRRMSYTSRVVTSSTLSVLAEGLVLRPVLLLTRFTAVRGYLAASTTIGALICTAFMRATASHGDESSEAMIAEVRVAVQYSSGDAMLLK